jgi:hypothetical protein
MEAIHPLEDGEEAGSGAVPLIANDATTLSVVAAVVVIAGKPENPQDPCADGK